MTFLLSILTPMLYLKKRGVEYGSTRKSKEETR